MPHRAALYERLAVTPNLKGTGMASTARSAGLSSTRLLPQRWFLTRRWCGVMPGLRTRCDHLHRILPDEELLFLAMRMRRADAEAAHSDVSK